MPLRSDIPPTAGLPARFGDFMTHGGDFAAALTRALEIPTPILTASGTAAFIVALRTLAAGQTRDIVILPGFSCPLVVRAVVHCGLKVRLCDTAPNHFDFDFARLAALADHRTLAIVSTHLAGRVADAAAAQRIAQAVGAFVIEDAAQALGARKDGRAVGLVGDVGFFSLAVGKGLTTFEGGVLFSASDAMQRRLRATAKALLPPRRIWELRRCLEFLGYALFYRPSLLPYFYGMRYRRAVRAEDWLTATGEKFGISIPMHPLGGWRQRRAERALRRLPDHIRQTTEIARRFRERLRRIASLQVIGDADEACGVWPSLMVVMPDRKRRDMAIARLASLGLGVGRLFAYPLNAYEDLRGHLAPEDRAVNALPAAQRFADRLLTLSTSPWLSELQCETIGRTIEILCSETGLGDDTGTGDGREQALV